LIDTKNILITTDLEKTITKLFPKHKAFYALNSKDCKILTYKSICLNNHLHWFGGKFWPNDNTNEFLTYHLYTNTPEEFLSLPKVDTKPFLYADLVSMVFNQNIKNLLSIIFSQCRKPSMVLFNGNQKLDHELQSKVDSWAVKKFLVVDLNTNETTLVLINYDNKNIVESPGNNANQRQQIKRKGKRWVDNLSKLPSAEQDFILFQLLTSYANKS
jgi:hypothetical protein